jgi:hypothetical protein
LSAIEAVDGRACLFERQKNVEDSSRNAMLLMLMLSRPSNFSIFSSRHQNKAEKFLSAIVIGGLSFSLFKVTGSFAEEAPTQ